MPIYIISHDEAHLPEAFDQRYTAVFDQDVIFGTIQWSKPGWYAITQEEDQIVSILEIHARTLLIGGQAVQMGGISGVFTPEEHRSKGYAVQAVQHAVEFIRTEVQPEFALLVCKHYLIPLYESIGWEMVENPLVFYQSGVKQGFPVEVRPMIYRFSDHPWYPGEIDMQGNPW